MRILVFIVALVISYIWDADSAIVFYIFGRIFFGFLAGVFDSKPQSQSQSSYNKQYSQDDYYSWNKSTEDFNSYNSDGMETYYAVLGVSSNATDGEVKRAYRELVKKNHPDLVSVKGEAARQVAERKTQEINEAYENIKHWRGIN